MNLEESDLYKEKLEKNNRHRKSVMLSIVLCAILIVFLFILIAILKYQDSITEKLFINGTQVTIPKDFYKTMDDGSIYVNVRHMSSFLGYTYTKGEYNKFNEDEDSCYLQNDFEIVSISANSDKYKKYIQVDGTPTLAEIPVTMKNENGYNETFSLNKPIKFVDEKLYISVEDAQEILNAQIDWKEYRYKIYSLEYIVNNAKKIVGKAGYSEMSGYYENLKSVLYGYVVVGNGNKLYGVYSLVEDKEFISIKYDDIKFVQNVKEFYVTVANGTMGILASDGSTIIAPSEYEDISLLDDEKQLYLVKKDGEYGVVNRTGKTIIHAENDEIGLDISKFEIDEIENNSLIFSNSIPIKNDKKYGIYNLEGDLKILCDGLGYQTASSTTTSGNEESILTIPPSVGIKGIVINFNDLYGIYDTTTENLIIPCSFEKIYAIKKFGQITYYMDLGGEQYNIAEYLKENKLNNVDENGELLDKEKEITDTNENKKNLEESSNIANENTIKNVTNTNNNRIAVPVE